MALTVTHNFVSAIADGTDTTVVRPSNWNANHTVTGTINLSTDVTGSLPVGSLGGLTANQLVAGTGTVPTAITVAGDLTLSSGSFTIANSAVTYAKMQAVSAVSKLLGSSASTTAVQEITLGTNLSMTGTTLNATGGAGGLTLGTTTITGTGNATGNLLSQAAGGLLAEIAPAAGITTFLATPSSANLATAITDETGTGTLVFSTSPALVTPTLGVATATSINKVTITAPATSATLTVANGKTLTANNSLTLAGTDATTITFPAVNGKVAALDIADQTLSGGANCTTFSNGSSSFTVDCGKGPIQSCTITGIFTITAPANDGSCVIIGTNSSATSLTFTGFTTEANHGDTYAVTGTNKYSFFIWRAGGTSSYRIAAQQ